MLGENAKTRSGERAFRNVVDRDKPEGTTKRDLSWPSVWLADDALKIAGGEAAQTTILLSTRCDCRGIVSVAEGGGRRIERRRGSAVADLARLLLSDGADPAAELHVADRGTGQVRLMPKKLGAWARTMIVEGEAPLRIVRWRLTARETCAQRPYSPKSGVPRGDVPGSEVADPAGSGANSVEHDHG